MHIFCRKFSPSIPQKPNIYLTKITYMLLKKTGAYFLPEIRYFSGINTVHCDWNVILHLISISKKQCFYTIYRNKTKCIFFAGNRAYFTVQILSKWWTTLPTPIFMKKFYRHKIEIFKMEFRALCSQVKMHTFFQNFFEIFKIQHKKPCWFFEISIFLWKKNCTFYTTYVKNFSVYNF